ncbi:MAG: FadR/GntR family transcriptional regulator [Pseudomonadota bacterium]
MSSDSDKKQTGDSAFEPVERTSIAEQVAERLRGPILNGLIKPGERLPTERNLAEQLNVTRTTVREALRKLEQLKLIGVRQGQGITVRDFRAASLDLLGYLIQRDGVLDSGVMHNILEARVLVGTEVARLSALRAGAGDIEKLAEVLDQLETAGDARAYQLLDFEFFRCLSEASHNLVYTLLMNTLRGLHRSNVALFTPLSGNLGCDRQRQIFAAIEAGDPDVAERAAREYFTAGLTLFEKRQNEQGGRV